MTKPVFNAQFLFKDEPQEDSSQFPQFKVHSKDFNFGILKCELEESDISEQTIHIVANCDRSGSMWDSCQDGKTKMEHLQHTLRNLKDYFLSLPENVKGNLTLIGFDNKTDILCENLPLNEENQDKIDAVINKLKPRGMTNIEGALKCAEEISKKYKEENPEDRILHILLTDGDITQGASAPSTLHKYLNPEVTNAFMGYGSEHNEHLLIELAKIKRGEYYFIESLENAGMVYGEVLHGVLYEALKNLEITVEDGEIYNYKTNLWEKNLTIESLPSGVTKTYHIREPWGKMEEIELNPDDDESNSQDKICLLSESISFQIKYKLFEQENTYTDFNIPISYPKDDTKNLEVERYLYRQLTLEHLYKTQLTIINNASHITSEQQKTHLKLFLQEMKDYMKEQDLEQNQFMKTLCDDIYVAIQSLNSSLGHMYLCARTDSQGKQKAYNICNIDLLLGKQRYSQDHFYSRNYSMAQSGGMVHEEPVQESFCRPAQAVADGMSQDDDLHHTMSNNAEGVYTGRTQSDVMRSLSGPQ